MPPMTFRTATMATIEMTGVPKTVQNALANIAMSVNVRAMTGTVPGIARTASKNGIASIYSERIMIGQLDDHFFRQDQG